EHDGKRREGDAQDAEDQRGEAADQQRRNARELLAQLDAEELEAGLAERYDVGEHGARRFEHALAHLRASRRPTTRPTAAAMPTAASGWSRTCASSWNPASSMRARAFRSASSARPRSSCRRSASWPEAAFRSSSAAATTSRYSSISLSPAASMGPPFAMGAAMMLGKSGQSNFPATPERGPAP